MADNKLELVVEVDANRANASIKSVNASLTRAYTCTRYTSLVSHKTQPPVMFWNRAVAVYFWTATNHCSRGVSWSTIAPPFITGFPNGQYNRARARTQSPCQAPM